MMLLGDHHGSPALSCCLMISQVRMLTVSASRCCLLATPAGHISPRCCLTVAPISTSSPKTWPCVKRPVLPRVRQHQKLHDGSILMLWLVMPSSYWQRSISDWLLPIVGHVHPGLPNWRLACCQLTWLRPLCCISRQSRRKCLYTAGISQRGHASAW